MNWQYFLIQVHQFICGHDSLSILLHFATLVHFLNFTEYLQTCKCISQNNLHKQHLKSKYSYQWTYQYHLNEVLVSLFTSKIVKMPSHVINITVYSCQNFLMYCKLWWRFWQIIDNSQGCTFYVWHISISST